MTDKQKYLTAKEAVSFVQAQGFTRCNEFLLARARRDGYGAKFFRPTPRSPVYYRPEDLLSWLQSEEAKAQ